MADAAIAVSRKGVGVRLTLLAPIANDLGALQKGLGSLREQLGPTACATGCDILEIMQEREICAQRSGIRPAFFTRRAKRSEPSRRSRRNLRPAGSWNGPTADCCSTCTTSIATV
jgi:hypothetical protein